MINIRTGPKDDFINLSIEGIDGPFQFLSLVTEEAFLGMIPKAELKIRCQLDPTTYLLRNITLSITNKQGYKIVAPMYIYSISYLNDVATINMMSYNTAFMRESHSAKFTNIKRAISSLSPVEVKTNSDTNLIEDIPIHQILQSDYKFLNRILRCYKIDTIFSFNLNAIKLNDLKNYKSQCNDFLLKGDSVVTTPPEKSNPKLYENECEMLDYSSSEDPNHTYLKMGKYWCAINNEYREAGLNYIHNLRFDQCKVSVNIKTKSLRDVEVTDGIKLNQLELGGNEFTLLGQQFISARVITLTPESIEVDYTIKSIEL